MTNMFENLTVEEPPEPDDFDPVVRKQDAVENISVTASDSADWDKLEAFVASVYLSRDSHRFREAIQEVWTFYQQGRMDLMAAAMTTNTAIEFCRRLQEEFEETFPNFSLAIGMSLTILASNPRKRRSSEFLRSKPRKYLRTWRRHCGSSSQPFATESAVVLLGQAMQRISCARPSHRNPGSKISTVQSTLPPLFSCHQQSYT
jgi:hypothetical protein